VHHFDLQKNEINLFCRFGIRLSDNVLQLGEVADFEALTFILALNFF
jgi:hypothetical protein